MITIKQKILGFLTPSTIDSLVAFMVRVASALASYILFVLVARAGSLEQYETFAFIFTLIGFFGPLANLGGVGIIFKHLSNHAKNNSEESRRKTKLILLTTFLGSIFFSIVAVLVFFSNDQYSFDFRWILFVIGLVFLSGYIEILFAFNRIAAGAKSSLAIKELLWRGFFLLGLFFLKQVSHININSLLVLLTFAFTISAATLLYRIKDDLLAVMPTRDFLASIPLNDFITFSALSAIGMALVHVDNIIVGSIMPASTLGAFFSSQRVIQVLYFFSQAIGIFAATVVRNAYQEQNLAAIKKSSRLNAVLAGSGAILSGLVIAFFSPEILSLFRPEFADQCLVLVVLLIGPVFFALGGYHSIIPVYCGAESVYLKYRLICFVVFLFFKIWLATFASILIYASVVSLEAIVITAIGVFISKYHCKISCF